MFSFSDFKNKLRNARELKGWDRKDLYEALKKAGITNLKSHTIQNWETGTTPKLEFEEIEALSKVLDQPVEFFIPGLSKYLGTQQRLTRVPYQEAELAEIRESLQGKSEALEGEDKRDFGVELIARYHALVKRYYSEKINHTENYEGFNRLIIEEIIGLMAERGKDVQLD